MHAIDWMPTLTKLAGAEVEGDLKWDGMDIWPVLTQPRKDWPLRTLYTAAPSFRAQAVRHGDWKYIRTAANGKKATEKAGDEELFNLADDPADSKNLAASQPAMLAQMKERLAAISARDKDAVAND
jgi:arylsulfatase A-like enzyme